MSWTYSFEVVSKVIQLRSNLSYRGAERLRGEEHEHQTSPDVFETRSGSLINSSSQTLPLALLERWNKWKIEWKTWRGWLLSERCSIGGLSEEQIAERQLIGVREPRFVDFFLVLAFKWQKLLWVWELFAAQRRGFWFSHDSLQI